MSSTRPPMAVVKNELEGITPKPALRQRSRSKSSERGCNNQSSQLSECEFRSSQSQDNFEHNSRQLHMPTEYLHKTEALRYILETDLLACDAKWTLFVAAALSYRYDCKLKPFPPRFTQEQTGGQIDAVVTVINDTPKLKVVLQYIIDQNFGEISIDVIDLLHWVLVTMREPFLRLVEEEDVTDLLHAVHGKEIVTKPTFVFEVEAAKGFHSKEEFRDRISDVPVKLAFCGQTLDSIFSILHHGFQTDTTEAIKLSTDLFTSVHQSPSGAAWGASQCGSLISCTALCEFASDTDMDRVTTNSRDKSFVDFELADANKLRARYLLFYGCRFPKERHPKNCGFMGWVTRHKYSLSLASYLLVLVTIGVANSGSGHTIKLFMSTRIQGILDLCKKIVVME